MSRPTWGWTAYVSHDFVGNGDRVFLGERLGDRHRLLSGFDSAGMPVMLDYDPVQALDFRGLLLPPGALDALALEVRPGPSDAELARVQEALDLERRRVDDVLRGMAE